jgi:phenylpropionate dioxygenase-like ring-hydroxylating dioxygenase large terminal subunit
VFHCAARDGLHGAPVTTGTTRGTAILTGTVDISDRITDDRVHGSLYTDPDVFEAELHRIFHRGWSFVGHESEVPSPGDWVTRRIGRDPVLLVRGRDGAVTVLANRCAHRGVLLCNAGSGNSGSFSCMFHGWTYSLAGELKGVPQPVGQTAATESLALDRPRAVASYRGFVFANPSGTAGNLHDHLGPGGRELIDWAADLSPEGDLAITAGWLGQRSPSNWKMWAESDNDGYHLGRLHASLWRVAPGTQYESAALAGEDRVTSTCRDRGNGHIELEFWRGYDRDLAWLGTTREQVADYVAALVAARGEQRATELLWKGPPHALIFPNLFLGEMNLARIEPVAADDTVHHHTPLLLAGVSDRFNTRILRQSEAAMGPAGFLLPDDATASERMQVAFAGTGGWMDLSRGLQREVIDGTDRVGHVSDETVNRGFWRHYRKVMGP